MKNKLSMSFIKAVTVVSVFLLTQCSNWNFNDKFTEGIVEYDIHYVNYSNQNFPLKLLPKTMEFKFNQNFASYTIEDKMGIFSIRDVKSAKDHDHTTMIKFFSEKYACQSKKKESPFFFKSNVPYKVVFLKDTFRMAGMSCKKANVTDINSSQSYDVAYTCLVGGKDPNANTPYKKINGLLMDFKLQIKNLEMTLTAKKIVSKKINDEDFLIPEGYKFISKKQMEGIISNLLP